MTNERTEDIVEGAVFYDEERAGVKVHIVEIDDEDMVHVNYTQNVYSMGGWEEENFDSESFPLRMVEHMVNIDRWTIDRIPLERAKSRGDNR